MQGNSNESLILKEQAEIEAAPFLFSDEELPRIDRTQRKFHGTGERLWRDEPARYKAVVKLLAEPGVSIRSICRELHVTDDTVRAVKERENIAIAAQKRTLLSNITHGARLASERVIEMMPTASAKDALLGVGILTDKIQLLSGEVTARVEQVHRVDLFSDWPDFVKSLERREDRLEENGGSEIHLMAANKFLTEDDRENPAIDVETEGYSSAAAIATLAGPAERQE
jgi:hypothetical protein